MPQPQGQNFEVQGRNINFNLRIELVLGDIDESSVELASVSEANVDSNDPSALNDEAPLLPVNDDEKYKTDSIASLKEQLQLTEMKCSGKLRLEGLYQKYRLRWLEENY
ncbi:uncharacterized protein F5147DRAFT_778066 [Suillus discolor]|uniref:Uncharacterized protein n=1 Tax=Suillus discolor TaxID=1912936 RepID=A0A9P7EXU7_9AGAM|nr:uncharacterized protein F5147DRAFT_778066 [Suillus discolor]KAG2097264.1 hypothetical protein F5147DRAFT_778066 [Suillus discolor]